MLHGDAGADHYEVTVEKARLNVLSQFPGDWKPGQFRHLPGQLLGALHIGDCDAGPRLCQEPGAGNPGAGQTDDKDGFIG